MKAFCPNCEKETECDFTAKLYECKECQEDFASYEKEKQSDSMSVNFDTENIYIKIPINLLVFAQENNPDNPCKINNKGIMLEYFQTYFLNFGESEEAGSGFERLLDKFFSDATEYGEEWVDFVSEKE